MSTIIVNLEAMRNFPTLKPADFILYYLVWAISQSKYTEELHDGGRVYFTLHWHHMAKSLADANTGIDKRSLFYKKMERLCKAKLLHAHPDNKGGELSYYAPGEKAHLYPLIDISSNE
jgi:hypothetical protein